jgi:SAM-dependent methyltransferase
MTLAPVWHDLECGYYTADLQLWEELSHQGDSVLDLGCGNGRVTMHLARLGRKVTGLDTEKRFLEVLEGRAAQCGLTVDTVCADVRGFDLGVQFDAVFAPMQLVQLLKGSAERKAMLAGAARHLRPGGVFAATLMNLEDELVGDEYGPPRPDVREVNHWVFSSLSLAANLVERGRAIQIDRLRTAVSPEGEQHTTIDEVRLELVSPAFLEREVAAAGLDIQEQRTIPPTEHVGSVVVIARLPGGASLGHGKQQPITASIKPGRFSLAVQPGAPSSRSASSTIRPSGPRT